MKNLLLFFKSKPTFFQCGAEAFRCCCCIILILLFTLNVSAQNCSTPDLCPLATATGATATVNGANVTIGNATLTISGPTFSGGATQDEDEINNSHTGGPCGPKYGMFGGPGDVMTVVYNFSEPVCDFTSTWYDIDNEDILTITATGPNGPVGFTVNTLGTEVAQNGNSFENTTNGGVGGGTAGEGLVELTFNDCVTSVTAEFTQEAGGTGGSYTFVAGEGCTNTEGCTNPAACNYDPDATVDNGSCDLGVIGCADPCAPVRSLCSSCWMYRCCCL